MRAINIFFFTIIISSFLFSCNNKAIDNTYSIEAALENCKEVPLSRYASDIEYIPLETSSISAVAHISNLDADDEHIYIFCIIPPQKVLVFDKRGNFISEIERNGRGPEEYNGVNNFTLEKNEKETYVSLLSSSSILSYRKDGSFVRKIDINVPSKGTRLYSLNYLNNGKYALIYSNDIRGKNSQIIKRTRKLFVIDTTGNVTYDKDLPISIPTHTGQYFRSQYAYSYNGGLRIGTGMESKDSLILLNNNFDTLSSYIFEFGDLRPDTNEKGAQIWGMVTRETDRFLNLQIYAPWEAVTKIFPKRDQNSNVYFSSIYLDKETDELYAIPYNYEFSFSGLINDLDEGGIPFVPQYVCGNKMYHSLPADRFIEYAQMSNSAKMKEVAANLTDESNPVLIVATLK